MLHDYVDLLAILKGGQKCGYQWNPAATHFFEVRVCPGQAKGCKWRLIQQIY